MQNPIFSSNNPRYHATSVLFITTISLSAFLVFQVQPIISKHILPWFGGTPSVWSVCLLFFQLFLFGGYCYAHFLTKKLPVAAQVAVHAILLCLSLIIILTSHSIPSPALKPSAETVPMIHIVKILTLTIGLPYFVLSATSPLAQHWYSRLFPGKEPYGLFAFSNAGSLLALISYPFLIEPRIALHTQSAFWSLGFGFFVASCLTIMVFIIRATGQNNHPVTQQQPIVTDDAAVCARHRRSKNGFNLFWMLLPMLAAMLLMAITNQLCTDIASGPFLWIVPLSIYLITYIIAFTTWNILYHRIPIITILVVGSIIIAYTAPKQISLSLLFQIGLYCTVLFCGCFAAHCELYRQRPDKQELTHYYLWISAGGAAGGIACGLVAPTLFKDFYELPITCTVLTASLATIALSGVVSIAASTTRRRVYTWMAVVAVVLVGSAFMHAMAINNRKSCKTVRNFFGVCRLYEYYRSDPAIHQFSLVHGTTEHGLQFLEPSRRAEPTTYFAPTSGVGIVLKNYPRNAGGLSPIGLHVGIVGLGVGTIAAYAQPADTFTFYEINPAIIALSEHEHYFTYVSDARKRGACVTIKEGDGRLSLEREAGHSSGPIFDILILDAFSSDAIPMHLLTKEAFILYQYLLKKEGALVVQLTNRHVDLSGVIAAAARYFTLQRFAISSEADPDLEIYPATWNILTNNSYFSQQYAAIRMIDDTMNTTPLWSDDFSNLWQVLVR
ncbi:MAG: fused MFS/spermidine synthase [Chitinivibrionales bacterium]|nr:fused MFS/spermidine synthase [Chitinivibrionales bacterium]